MAKKEKMSQQERTESHKKRFPENESRRKGKQRQSEEVMRFHIIRHHLYKYKIPKEINQDSDMFNRIKEGYLKTLRDPVEIEEVSKGG